MLTSIFENRDAKLRTIFAIGDSLSRSLRKGLELFSIDGPRVTFLSEDKKLISGDLDGASIVNIEISDSSVFEDAKAFSDLQQTKMDSLIESLRHDKLSDASTTFTDILKIWNLSSKLDRVSAKLQDKLFNLTANTKIVESEEFTKIKDLRDNLVSWMTENKDTLLESEQIINSVLLADKVSKAFAFKKLAYKDLEKSGAYEIVNENYLPTYQIICQQELIKKELLEAKESLDTIWAEDQDFDALSKLILENDKSKIEECLAKVVSNVPYFAFASKAQISTILFNKLSLTETSHAAKDVKTFASLLFEMKKPVRDALTRVLSERYGVSLNNLKDVPSFKTLVGAQVTIFESLAKLAKKSIFKSVLKEFAEFLKTRNGVEILDVNEFVNSMFKDAGVTLTENSLMQYLDFNRVADDVMKIGAVLKMIQGATQNPQMGSVPGVPLGTVPTPGTSPQIAPPAQQPMAGTTPMAGAGPMPGGTPNADPMSGNAQMPPQDQYPSDESDPAMAAAQGAKQDMAGAMGAQGAIPQEPTPMAQNQLVAAMGQLDALLQDLTMQIGRATGGGGTGLPPEAGGMGGEMPHGEPDGDEGIPGQEGEFGDEEGGDEFSGGEEGSEEGDNEIEYVDMTGDEEGGGEEESEEDSPPPKKDKKGPSKPLNKSKPKK